MILVPPLIAIIERKLTKLNFRNFDSTYLTSILEYVYGYEQYFVILTSVVIKLRPI